MFCEYKMSLHLWIILLFTVISTCVDSYFNPHIDSVYFGINWAGADESFPSAEVNSLSPDDSSSSVIVRTARNERYRCTLPKEYDLDKEEEDDKESVEALELDLLKPLFDQTACTYRLETYWTYELCHGKHLRQYHEEKEIGKKTRLTEYYLGRYKPEYFNRDYNLAKDELTKHSKGKKHSSKTKKVQGIEIQYYEVMYDDGTVCDLTGVPRRVALHYVCQPDGRGEIYELKETSSCEYEVVVLTSLLCPHASYGPKKESVNTINCHSLDGSPRRPVDIDVFENNQRKYNSKELWDMLISSPAQEEDEDEDEETPTRTEKPSKPRGDDIKIGGQIGEHTDKLILRQFLAGDFCINGGTGWWHYEFCYGKHVKQYHEENGVRKATILLGTWDTAAHLLWVSNNPRKRPLPVGQRQSLRHYYVNGDYCDETGARRVAEVKLKCLNNPDLRHSMAIYVLEEKTCQYQVGVESPLLCSIISQADSDGLILEPKV